jgi:hypothetical protein
MKLDEKKIQISHHCTPADMSRLLTVALITTPHRFFFLIVLKDSFAHHERGQNEWKG